MIDRLGWTLIHSLWEGAAVAAFLAVALLVTRRAPAALRYAFALAALFLTVALPVATFLVLTPAEPVIASSGAAHYFAGETIAGGATSQEKMPLVVALWGVGVALMSLRLVGTLIHLERWRRRYAHPAPAEEQNRLNALARRLGLRRAVTLLFSEEMQVPSAWGVLRPVVVLPVGFVTGMPPEQVEGILLHELAHIRRHDYLVNLIQSVVETALFYHPAVWWVSSVVRREREFLCDDVAVATLGDPMPYARALLSLAERRQTPPPALSVKEGNLMNRIARILAPRPAPVRISPVAPTLAAVGVLALVLGGFLRAEAQSSKTDSKKNVFHITQDHPAKRKVVHGSSASEAQRLRVEVAQLKHALAVSKEQRLKVASNDVLLATGKVAVVRTDRSPSSEVTVNKVASASGRVLNLKANPTRNEAVTIVGNSRSDLALSSQAKNAIAVATSVRARTSAVNGFGQAVASEPEVLVDAANMVSVDADHVDLPTVLRLLAKKAKLAVVVQQGIYSDVTVVLPPQNPEEELRILCRAGNATYRNEGGVYYISPIHEAPVGGGFGGGGGLGG